MLVLLSCLAFPAAAGSLGVTLVLSEEGGAYAEFADALGKSLGGNKVNRVVLTSPDALPHSGLLIGVGMKAASAIVASDARLALNVLVPKPGYEKLLHEYPGRAASRDFSAIYLDQPINRLVHLVAAAFPGKKAVGMLYAIPPGNLALFRKKLLAHDMSLYDRQVGVSLIEALQDVLEHSDVLLALPDAEIYNASTIRNILLTAYNSNIPLVGFSPAYVRAGALCALYSTPEQIAAQTAAAIRQLEAGAGLPSPSSPNEFEVMVNEQVARSLGLQIRSAARLHDEIEADEREEP